MNNILKKKKEIIICAVIIVVIIIAIILLKPGKSSNDDDKKDDNVEQKVVLSEKDIADAYGMTTTDAINIVKEIYNSDNFEFSAVVNESSKYTVTVKNTITDVEYKYEVDPVTESFYEIK